METRSPSVSDLHAVKSRPSFASGFDSGHQSGWCGPLAVTDKHHIRPIPVFFLETIDNFRHHPGLVIAATERETEKFQQSTHAVR